MLVILLPKMEEMLWATKAEKLATPRIHFLSDNQGVMLIMSTPQEGQYHDLFQIQLLFDELGTILKAANINLKGLFLNADPGFDSADFVVACHQQEIIANVKPNARNSASSEQQLSERRTHVFDDQLYQDRSVIEHTNAWIDSFNALLVPFEFSVKN